MSDFKAVREALAAGPSLGSRLIADEDSTFVYALGPDGTNSFWAHFTAAGPERVGRERLVANAKLAAACDPTTIAALLQAADERNALKDSLMRAAGCLAGAAPRMRDNGFSATAAIMLNIHDECIELLRPAALKGQA